jgi:hypothetical protein
MRDAAQRRGEFLKTAFGAVCMLAAFGLQPANASPPSAARTPRVIRIVATARDPRVWWPARGARIIHGVAEVTTARPAGGRDRGIPERDDARAAGHGRRADPATIAGGGREHRHAQKLPNPGAAIDSAGARRLTDPTSRFPGRRDLRRAASAAVYHEAHAPPRHA